MTIVRTRLQSTQAFTRRSASARRAAILVAVLIVMMIVGLLTAQAVRMMIAIRQGDQQRAKLQQARELVELASQTLDSESGAMLFSSFEMELPGGATAEVMFEGSSRDESSGPTADQKIVAQEVERIIARYRSSPETEFIATKTLTDEPEARESNDD